MWRMPEKRFELAHRRRVRKVLGQRRQPRLVEGLDHLEQRPHRTLRQPRVGVGSVPEARARALETSDAREREVDVGADAVVPARAGAQTPTTAAVPASARCPGSARTRLRESSGRRAGRPPGRPASTRARRPARSGGRAAPGQSTSRLLPAGQPPRPSVGAQTVGPTSRCWRSPRAATGWSRCRGHPRRRSAPPPGGAGAPPRSVSAPGSGPRSRR